MINGHERITQHRKSSVVYDLSNLTCCRTRSRLLRLLDDRDSRTSCGKIVSIEATGSQHARDQARAQRTNLSQQGAETYSINCAHTEMMDVEPVPGIGPVISDVFTRLYSGRETSPNEPISNARSRKLSKSAEENLI